MTGEGIVLPTEDAEEVDARFATLEAEMKPRNELARNLLFRIALMLLKLDRSTAHEAKATGHRMRQAEAVLARKYEAANERSLYRALKKFREVQGVESEVDFEPEVASEPSEELARLFPSHPRTRSNQRMST